MSNRNTLIRSLHDLGLASWFGGSLMGALGLNGASQDVSDPTERTKVAAAGWARWSPVAAASIGAHIVGGIGLVIANRDRVQNQKGVGANSVVKASITVAAMATTAYSGVLGAQLANEPDQPTAGGTTPNNRTSPKVARIQQQLRVLQWATPVLTGALVVLGAQQGEQQKPGQMLTGRALKVAGDLRNKVA
ncbi:hypothetical protein [Lapillicoccus sp.]|uniref:hypothetical protein n=1 Tax=Lapillicoccus sp. TaxID=1909287 RepID=UPI0032674AEC